MPRQIGAHQRRWLDRQSAPAAAARGKSIDQLHHSRGRLRAGLQIDAHAIATRYFAREIAVEGSVGEGILRGEHWAFPAKFGVAGRAAPDPILVHATTGAVSWAGLADHRARVESLKRKPR